MTDTQAAARPSSKLPPYSPLHEPLLAFTTNTGGQAQDSHPLRGLVAYGPYTRTSLAAYTPTIRVATVGPPSSRRLVSDLIESLSRQHHPTDRPDYVPAYPGFRQLFGVNLEVAHDPEVHIPLPESLDVRSGTKPSGQAAEVFADTVTRLTLARGSFDVATVHLPDAWPRLRGGDFDAHDHVKALAAVAGIPTQILNDRVFSFRHQASRAWRLGIAFYVKAGGVPWKLTQLPGVPNQTAYIGLAYALRSNQSDARFVTCCSQVFDSDGGGMQFVAYDARDPIEDIEQARDNPYLSRDDMRAVLARSLRLYQARNGGSVPRRVVIHKNTQFRDEEVAGAAEALSGVDEIDCLEITTNVPWRAVWLKASRNPKLPSEPDAYPVHRGTMLPLSGTAALLWAAGNAPSASLRGNYYQGKKSIPRPIRLQRYAGSGPLEMSALEALALTKMDWNNDALYDPVPVTVRYAQGLARTIARVPDLPRVEYPYRLFM